MEILLTSESVRELLDTSETISKLKTNLDYRYRFNRYTLSDGDAIFDKDFKTRVIHCRKDKKGEIFPVKEPWQQEAEWIDYAGSSFSNAYLNATGNYLYKADGVSLEEVKGSIAFGKWKPARIMPKKAVRL